MAERTETPSASRVHIAFFGLRNAGKSTLVNAFCGQNLAIVSDTPGTTTDPVSKAMEILPLGPCRITDTAGLNDAGELGARRVKATLDVLETTDIAVWVWGLDGETPSAEAQQIHARFLAACRQRGVLVVEHHRDEEARDLRARIAACKLADALPGLLDELVESKDRVVCVCPIDAAAPQGRLILPQVQVIRECLDRHIVCTVVQPSELNAALSAVADTPGGKTLVVTDSQAFGTVKRILDDISFGGERVLTSFSILFARQKGDLAAFENGIAAIGKLKDGDTVLIAEGCTHHRQCNDIGSVKIPKALEKLSGRKLRFVFASGNDFPLADATAEPSFAKPRLIVHCGGCMLTRRAVLRRIARAGEAGIPIVNYGMLLAKAQLGSALLGNVSTKRQP